jgi:hypothetical protein
MRQVFIMPPDYSYARLLQLMRILNTHIQRITTPIVSARWVAPTRLGSTLLFKSGARMQMKFQWYRS